MIFSNNDRLVSQEGFLYTRPMIVAQAKHNMEKPIKKPIEKSYAIGYHYLDGHDSDSGISDADYENLSKLRPVNPIYETKKARKILGPVWREDFSNILKWGVKVKEDYLPKTYYVAGSERALPDFQKMWGAALVSEKFKSLVEIFEPNIHQFAPVDLVWKDQNNKPVDGNWYFFIVGQNIDSVNEKLSELPPRKKVVSPRYGFEVTQGWKIRSNGGQPARIVLDKDKLAHAHIWRDGYLQGQMRASDQFKEAAISAGISGIDFGVDALEVA